MTFIVRPDLDEDGSRGVVDAVTGRLESAGGEILATVPWNPPRRRMAYPIRDFGDGFYVTTVFKFDPQGLRAVENQFRLNENILRFLIIQATEHNVNQAQQRMQQAAARPQPAPATEAEPIAEQPPAEANAITPELEATPPPAPESDPEPVAAAVTESAATQADNTE
jgi:small subunit ribosomal protein S6